MKELDRAVGRGVEDGPSDAISADDVVASIEDGLGCRLPVGAVQIGHARCNRYGIVLVAGGRAAPAGRGQALANFRNSPPEAENP